ncbi:ribosome small subunit-dependent GTPase A [Adlercreutzia equolifaciens]|uniref:ribosome small subunit-dependent GTPase A n=1 Tax=Adlercreutzia equolifaciens TaxID=446660 RepID=UPI0023AF9F2D|nr:ribosome small subunit-dependent GTPase A [Adlercreutzia equolifaciens]MDE8701903.1 ribosome small subunit-dependent GTPase A [Adlercreutzia equolifaciens]
MTEEWRAGEVIKLDRGYPLVRFDDGTTLRCEHATALVKGEDRRAVIGDRVEVSVPDSHDKGVIESIAPRTREFVRKDPTERALPQVLAANFERVIVAQPLSEVNLRRLERELVLAFETGAQVTVVLTKADLAEDEEATARLVERVQALAGPDTAVLVVSEQDPSSVEAVRALLEPGTTTVLIGRSGVGKSSLINMLVGSAMLEVGSVRETDGKGRHTTVSREIVTVPGAGRIVDMPGVRGLGLWDADNGIEAAFPDIAALAEQCRFRDCQHEKEPGCAVRAAVEAGELSPERLASYLALKQEMAAVKERREQARRMSKESVPPSKRGRKGAAARKRHR